MTAKHEQGSPALNPEDISKVYEQLGLSTPTSRAYFAALGAVPAPTIQLSVQIGSTSVPSR